MPPQNAPITNTNEWTNRYWFTPLHSITVVNPLAYNFEFKVEGRHFMIKAGEHRVMPGTVANVYLDQVTRILAQDEDKLGFLSDYNLRALYYDRLIVDKTEIEQFDTTPAYLQQATTANTDTPPWANMQPAVEPKQATTPPAPSFAPEKTDKPAETTKEFVYNEVKYKMITDKNGNPHFYKAGKLTSEAEYAKAASMIA